MPKIVNREARKHELAQQAAVLFSTYGYNGLGMRDIAAKLKISKSALYHYFPSKQKLFDAATQVVVQDETQSLTAGLTANMSHNKKLELLHSNMLLMEEKFSGEIVLMQDYIRLKSVDDVRNDPNLKLAAQEFENSVSNFVGKNNAYPVICLYYGAMLQRMLDGKFSNIDAILEWLKNNIEETEF